MTGVPDPKRGAADLVHQLRSAIRKMEVALGAIGDAIVWTDASGAIEWCNETFEGALGRPRISFLGASVFDLLPLERDGVLLERTAHPAHRALADGTSPLGTYRWRGLGMVVELSATRSQIGAGAPTVILAMRDVTERIALEQEVRRKNEELQDQYRRLQVADRIKSQFLANMSHELRTPLNGIVGFVELIHDGKVGAVSAKQQEYLGHILTNAWHLVGLINDVLDLAKGESGALELKPEPVEPAALVGEVVDSLRSVSEQKRLHVTADIAPDLGPVVTDARKLKQVIYNYLSNALKFTPSGGQVRIGVKPFGEAHFRLEVADTGPGIARADLARLFVDFQQLEAGTSKQHQGTGLGLALTKRLVEAQGGSVGVESEVGRGSLFFAVLPRSSEQRREAV